MPLGIEIDVPPHESLLHLAQIHAPCIVTLDENGSFGHRSQVFSRPLAQLSNAEGDPWRDMVRNAEYVFFGEKPEQPDVLAAQLCVLYEMSRAALVEGKKVSVVLEMFHTPNQQPLLDRFARKHEMQLGDMEAGLNSTGEVLVEE
ncbi:hypothetical protein CYMTET_8640 [Cymbomonas tetramitiformis]|uniref:Haem-binding uptake Tiki superfamily ChaN domain-containing protein n=1 Tax=Cymbomonas tetramitiformis TaxID=36881 RepID=A0AAE0GTD1_9CHLO|nr:hypothetical protein CYMTET_8640 [Cymbomonas tetramitiformis]